MRALGDPEKVGLRLRALARKRDVSRAPSLQVFGPLSLGNLGKYSPKSFCGDRTGGAPTLSKRPQGLKPLPELLVQHAAKCVIISKTF